MWNTNSYGYRNQAAVQWEVEIVMLEGPNALIYVMARHASDASVKALDIAHSKAFKHGGVVAVTKAA